MKRVILLLALMFSLFAAHAQVNIPRQELRYNAHYHWGMVDVMIGHGVVTMECRDNRFNATIDGNSIPVGRESVLYLRHAAYHNEPHFGIE